jgi:hypothetical protein
LLPDDSESAGGMLSPSEDWENAQTQARKNLDESSGMEELEIPHLSFRTRSV